MNQMQQRFIAHTRAVIGKFEKAEFEELDTRLINVDLFED